MRLLLCEPDQLFAEALEGVLVGRGHEVVHGSGFVDLRDEPRAPRDDIDVAIACPAADERMAPAIFAAQQQAPTADLVVLVSPGLWAFAAEIGRQIGARAVLTTDGPLDALIAAVEGRDLRRLAAAPDAGADSGSPWLTRRELQALEALVDGCTTEEVSLALGISIGTARTHIQNLMMKLGVHSRIEAVAVGLRDGLVQVRRERAV